MLQISAVTRLRSVAITEDARSQDSFIRKPSRAAQLEAPPTKQTLTGRLHCLHLLPPASLPAASLLKLLQWLPQASK